METIKSVLDTLNISEQYFHHTRFTALGIGDILNSIIMLRDGIITGPIVVNLMIFTNTEWYPDPLNALKFRVNLINMLLENNHLDKSLVAYIFSPYPSLNEHLMEINNIMTWNLNLCSEPTHNLSIPSKYIIFHTKYRIIGHYGNDCHLSKLKSLYEKLNLSKYTIILMGERHMVSTNEQNVHRISTIYESLLELKNNHQVIDLTQDTIYNSLDINRYIMDCNLIKNAYKNILVGFSGQLCSCLAFNYESVICLAFDRIILFNDNLHDNIIYEFDRYEQLLMEL